MLISLVYFPDFGVKFHTEMLFQSFLCNQAFFEYDDMMTLQDKQHILNKFGPDKACMTALRCKLFVRLFWVLSLNTDRLCFDGCQIRLSPLESL